MKPNVVANRAILVSSRQAGKDARLGRILQVMMHNRYPRKSIGKVVTSQIKRHTSCAFKRQKQTTNEARPITVRILFVEGLSQEVCRIARTAGVRCAFFTPNTLCSLFTSKDQLPADSITGAVYGEMQNVLCRICRPNFACRTCTKEGTLRCDKISTNLQVSHCPACP